jgi:hypothetical protein
MPLVDIVCMGPASPTHNAVCPDTLAAPREIFALEVAYRQALPWYMRPLYLWLFGRV